GQVLAPRVGARVEAVVGGAHVRELGVGAPGGDDPPGEKGVLGGDGAEGAVGVPEAIAELEEPHPILGRHDLAVLVQVGEVRDARTKAMILGLPDMAGRLVVLQRAEVEGERDLLLVGESLVAEDEDGVPIHARLDGRHVFAADGPSDVDARDEAGERAAERLDGDGHDRFSARALRFRSWRRIITRSPHGRRRRMTKPVTPPGYRTTTFTRRRQRSGASGRIRYVTATSPKRRKAPVACLTRRVTWRSLAKSTTVKTRIMLCPMARCSRPGVRVRGLRRPQLSIQSYE